MSTESSRSRSGKYQCIGGIEVREGTLSVNCMECEGGGTLSDRNCFIGLSGRMIPGFRGEVILRKELNHGYTGAVVEALVHHSRILTEIRTLGETNDGRSAVTRGMARVRRDLERSFLRDPMSVVNGRELYLKEIRKVSGGKGDHNVERLLSIMESISLMVRKLERNVGR